MTSDDRNTRIALFQKREIRRAAPRRMVFVITDIIAALTDSPDPSGYWKKMRRRDPDLGRAPRKGQSAPANCHEKLPFVRLSLLDGPVPEYPYDSHNFSR